MFLTLKKMGFAQAAACEHVAYEMVELPSGAMSSRAGTIILFRALREQLAAALERHHFESLRAESKMGEDEIQQAITEVSLAAIKYGMLARDNNQKIVFDMDKWTQVHGGEGGAALAYVTARSASLLRTGATLTGEVFDDAGKPAARWMVQVTDTSSFSQEMAFTESDGRFRVEHLAPPRVQQVADDPHGPRRVQHVHRRRAVLRRDLDCRVLPAGGRPADEQGRVHVQQHDREHVAAVRDAAHRRAVPSHELLERRAIAGLRGDDQLGFG